MQDAARATGGAGGVCAHEGGAGRRRAEACAREGYREAGEHGCWRFVGWFVECVRWLMGAEGCVEGLGRGF